MNLEERIDYAVEARDAWLIDMMYSPEQRGCVCPVCEEIFFELKYECVESVMEPGTYLCSDGCQERFDQCLLEDMT